MKLICVDSGSSGNAYLLEDSKGKIIILDCGMPYRRIEKAAGFRTSDIEFALVTHAHQDHSSGINQLFKNGIEVFTNREVAQAYNLHPWLAERKSAMLCGWKVTPFMVPHTDTDGTPVQNYAFLIEHEKQRFLYMTDWMYCPYNLERFNINHFLIAVNYTDLEGERKSKVQHVLQGHSSLETAKEFLKTSMSSYCESIIACHLSAKNADEEQILLELKELAPEHVNVAIAKKGAIINL